MLKDFEKLIDNETQFKDSLRERFGLPVSLTGQEIYIWGAGKLAKFVIKQLEKNELKVKGVVTSTDDRVGDSFENTHFVERKQIEKEALIIVCSQSYPVIFETIEKMGHKKYVYYEIIPFIYENFTRWDMSYNEIHRVWFEKGEKIKKVMPLLLHDEISVEVFKNVLMYRTTLQNEYIDKAYFLSIERGSTYFDKEIIKLGSEEVFIDCGGYVGDSTEMFIMNCHNRYEKIIFFEPNSELMETARENLKKYPNITYYAKAVGEKEGVAFFTPLDASGMVSDNGQVQIPVSSIDGLIPPVCATYIKMDIEGSEMDALRGGLDIIKRCVPKLAISIYHKHYDLFEIIEFIDSLNLGYEFYVRHYTRTLADTVLYCIPDMGR